MRSQRNYRQDSPFRILRKLQNERGEISEEKVSRACAALKQKGFIYDFSQSKKTTSWQKNLEGYPALHCQGMVPARKERKAQHSLK